MFVREVRLCMIFVNLVINLLRGFSIDVGHPLFHCFHGDMYVIELTFTIHALAFLKAFDIFAFVCLVRFGPRNCPPRDVNNLRQDGHAHVRQAVGDRCARA